MCLCACWALASVTGSHSGIVLGAPPLPPFSASHVWAWPEPDSASAPRTGQSEHRISQAAEPWAGASVGLRPKPGQPRAAGMGFQNCYCHSWQREVFSAAVAKLTSPGAHRMEKVSPKVKSGPRKAEPRARGREPDS